ncbi:NAD-dependent epimerase/dehydratase family protein [Arthrobacter sp. E44]|uniref:NAD-dependent epimerase/dehydratase family protein n=1 Tax=Arthrobacter sp. E44 TaxID=3341794 RepID=UPI0035A6F52B
MNMQELKQQRGRTVVTGGLGFVGRNMVDHLKSEGHQVVVLDMVDPGLVALSDDVLYRQADLREPKQVEAALGDADTVFHIAGNSSGSRSVEDPLFDFNTNAVATANVCAAACKTGVSRLVYLSSAMVYGRPKSVPMPESHATKPFLPYGASKLSGEHIVHSFHETYGLNTVIGRAFTLYGPGENPKIAGGEVSQYLRWHLNGQPIHAAGDIDKKTRDFTHVGDLARALELLSLRGEPGGVYNLGTGIETSLRTLLTIISGVTGRDVELKEDTSITEDTYRHVADVARVRALGYEPRMTLTAGVSLLVDFLGSSPELPTMPTIFKPEQKFLELAERVS